MKNELRKLKEFNHKSKEGVGERTVQEEENPWQQHAMFEGSHFRERVDVVELFCLEYTIEERLPRLKPPAENNSLFMYEVDGTLGSLQD